MQQITGLYIHHIEEKGRAVFTAVDIAPGSIIEICPVIVIPSSDVITIHRTKLHDYYFRWGPNQDQAAIALGYGSIYNHSKTPNAKVILSYDTLEIIIESTRDIKAGDELCINYIDQEGSKDTLWFESK